MCYKGKCLHCLKVETGALIYAILNLMYISIGSVISIAMFVNMNFVHHEAGEKNETSTMFGLSASVVLSMFILIFCINFAFAVLLIVGLRKRNPNYVKAFFIYGAVKVVLTVIIAILMLIGKTDGVTAIVLLVGSVFFALMLVLIRVTYKKLENDVKYNSVTNPINVVAKF